MKGRTALYRAVVHRVGEQPQSRILSEGTYSVGSSPDADLRLDTDEVPPMMAALHFYCGAVVVQHLGRGLAPAVNGRTGAALEVGPSDEVTFGPFTLRLQPIARVRHEPDGARVVSLRAVPSPTGD